MPINPTAGQVQAQPTRIGSGAINSTSTVLTVGATQHVITAATVSEQLVIQVQNSGTPASDSSVSVAIAPPTTANHSILATIPYSEFIASDSLNSGAARVFAVPIGWSARVRFNPGASPAASPNGVIVRASN